MNCHDTQKLLHAFVDAELDLTTTLAIEQHLQDCMGCARTLAELRKVRAAITDGSLYFEPPAELRGRIQAAVRGAGERTHPPRAFPWRGLAVAASLAFVALAGWEAFRLFIPRPSGDQLARELVASHVRSQMLPNHRVDVESSSQHMVKPWFEGKLDFPPPVYELETDGFELLGGRLDYLNGRIVAALVYKRRKHHINLYVWPSQDAASTPVAELRQGYHLYHWTQAGMVFWAISDLNEGELQAFVRLIQNRAREQEARNR